MRCWQAAVEVLRETGHPAVQRGDERLLHAIAERLGWEHDGPQTSRRVMAALNRRPGRLCKRQQLLCNGRLVSRFELSEEEAAL